MSFVHSVFLDDDDDSESDNGAGVGDMFRQFTVPHHRDVQAATTAPVEAASFDDCMRTMQRGFQLAGISVPGERKRNSADAAAASASGFMSIGDPVRSIHEIPELRKRRRELGYQAEDGTDEMRGNKPGDLFSEEYLREYAEREMLLDKDPYVRFAKAVSGSSNKAREAFIVQSDLQRAVGQRVIDAAERVRADRAARSQADSTGRRIDEQETRVRSASNGLAREQELANDLEATREQFLQFFVSGNAFKDHLERALIPLKDQNTSAAIFRKLTVEVVTLSGAGAIARTGANVVQEVAIKVANLQRDLTDAVKNGMPTTALLALDLATLYHSVATIGVLGRLALDGAFVHRAGSEYAAAPDLYVRDLTTLEKLLFGAGTDDRLFYTKISFLLYAHLNKMRRRAQLTDEPELLRPSPPTDNAGGGGGDRRRRTVEGADIIFDLGDDEYEAIAEDAPTRSFTADQLRDVQRKLGANQSASDTASLVELLLRPLYVAMIPHAFFSASEDTGDGSTASELGIGIQLFTGRFDHAVLFIVGVLMTTVDVLKAREPARLADDNAGVASIADIARAATETIVTIPLQIHEYKARARTHLFRKHAVLRALAAYVAARDEANMPLPYVSNTSVAVFKRYAKPDSSTKEDERAAERVFQHSLAGTLDAKATAALSTLADADIYFGGNSPKRFYALVRENSNQVTGMAVDEEMLVRIRAAEQKLRTETSTLQALIAERANRERDYVDDAKSDLARALKESYVPTAGQAMSPASSGYLFFTDLMVAALSEADSLLKEQVPCVRARFGGSDGLITSNEYSAVFAAVVSAQVRLIDARMPDTYRPVKAEERARMQMRSALDRMRHQASMDRSMRHIANCSCRG